MNKIQEIGKFLYESGLLFEINRSIFHPRGLALAISKSDGHIGLYMILDNREELEGFLFEKDAFLEGKEKLDNFDRENETLKKFEFRKSNLGFEIQTEEGINENIGKS